jgi:hypothetical protein
VKGTNSSNAAPSKVLFLIHIRIRRLIINQFITIRLLLGSLLTLPLSLWQEQTLMQSGFGL